MSTSSAKHEAGQSTPQTRYRKITACLRCRDRKKKCDRKLPVCDNCQKEKKECVYANDSQQLKEHKQKLHSLNRSFATKLAHGDRAQADPEVNPLIVTDPAFEEDADDDSADLGVKVGKLRLSDRVGGFVRPRAVEEISHILHVWHSKNPGLSQSTVGFNVSEVTSAEFLAPGPSYLAPSSATFMPSYGSEKPIHLLVSQDRCEMLLQQYWTCVHPIARVVHRPSFERRWEEFWQIVSSDREVPKSLEAIVSAVMFCSMVSLSEEFVPQAMGGNKQTWVGKLQSTTEKALSAANWLRTTKVETLQALVIYLIPLCRAEVSRAHSNIVAAAIRAAEGMGLHMDGTTRGFPAIETHQRRLIWYQLGLLDIRTCEATGPRPQMRADDFETQLPLNLDDLDIASNPDDSFGWTEMTATIIRMKCNEFIRQIWADRRALHQKQITITEVLLKIENFYQEMDRKYGRLTDKEVPIQRYGNYVYKIQILRTFAMILHQYHLNPQVDMSDRLKHVFIVKGIETMDNTIDFETDQDLAQWQWLSGALQQHHYALAMLMELCMNSRRKDASRLLRGLAYVFEPPDHMRPLEWIPYTVRLIRDRMKVYVNARKVRAPIGFMEQLRLESPPEASEGSSSVEREQTREGSQQSQTSSQMSVEQQEGLQSQSVGSATRQTPPLMPSQSESNSGSESPTAGMPTVSTKDIMDVDWEAVAHHFPAIGSELDMSNEQYSSMVSTGFFPNAATGYSGMDGSTGLNQSYQSYYSSIVTSGSQVQSQFVTSNDFGAHDTPSTFQAINALHDFHAQARYGTSSQYATTGSENLPGLGNTSAHGHHSSQSAAAGFPQQSDNEQNFGMGLYKPLNVRPQQ